MTASIYAAVLVVSTLLTWKGSDLLEESSARLSKRYGLPAIVQGSLVVAVGSSFPELTTTVASSLIHGEFALGMASIVGSAVFNILVIPGVAGLVGAPLRVDMRLVYRDAQFYLTSVAVLLLAFSFALIYEPVEGQTLQGTLTRPIALIPVAAYGLYLFLQQQEARGDGAAREPSGSPHHAQAPVRPAEAAESSGQANAPRSTAAESRSEASGLAGGASKDWLLLVGGLALVVGGVEGLLRTAIWLGDVLGTPAFFWGATVVAAATSVPDALISVRSARKGDADVAVGNVLGSNIFDLLVAIPVGVLVAGAAPVNYGVAAPLMAALTLATVVLFSALRTRLTLSRRESVLLLILYGAFLAWLLLETAGVLSWLQGAAR